MKKALKYIILIALALSVVFTSCAALAEEIADVTEAPVAKVEASAKEEKPHKEEAPAPVKEEAPAPVKEEATPAPVKEATTAAPTAKPEEVSAPVKEAATAAPTAKPEEVSVPVKEAATAAPTAKPEEVSVPVKEEATLVPAKEEATPAVTEEPEATPTPTAKPEEALAPAEEEPTPAPEKQQLAREVRIHVLQDKVQYGETFTLCAELIGYEGVKVDLQWQYNDGKGWQNAEHGNGLKLDVELTEETEHYEWRLEVAVAE